MVRSGADQEAILAEARAILAQLMGSRVSNSAWEAKSMGYLRETDQIVMNPDHRLFVAKEMALELAAQNLPAPEIELIYAAGSSVEEVLQDDLNAMEKSGKISEYDGIIGRKLARILCGGTMQGEWVDPWEILNLERESSLAIRGNEQTKARIAHMLRTGKPLRN